MQIRRAVVVSANVSVRVPLRRALATTAVAGLLSAGLAYTTPAQAGDCLVGYQALAGVQGLPKVREHICALDGDASKTLRVTFARLDEELAGNLARKERTPELEQLFGGADLVENGISTQLKVLFQFAHKITVPARNMRLTVTVGVLRGEALENISADLPSLNADEKDTRRLWSISSASATFDDTRDHEISSAVADKAINDATAWPNGFRLFYGCQNEAIQCTHPWRYLEQASELDTLERDTDKDVAAAQRRMTAAERQEDADRDKSDWDEDRDHIYKTHFSLLRYLAQGGWPNRFLVIHWAQKAECGGSFQGYYSMPALALDVAIVENASAEPMEIQDMVGAMDTAPGLRTGTGRATAVGPLHAGEMVVAPGGRLIIPLRITFFGGLPNSERRWGPMSKAEKMYQRIHSKSSDAMFTLVDKRTHPWTTYRKKASSFRRPELPESAEYLFGPKLHLVGFLLKNQDFKFDQTAPNLITLYGENGDQTEDTVEEPDVELRLHQSISAEGSCPILYVWDEATGDWVNRGKVIHAANGQDHEATSVVAVDRDARRFRLAEEEPEIASVRRAQLVLTLRDGRRVAIGPDQRSGATFPRKIPAYTATSFTYSVPRAYNEAGIARAELAVTGFYTRYSAIRVSQVRALHKP
jgi:hypothetical protein